MAANADYIANLSCITQTAIAVAVDDVDDISHETLVIYICILSSTKCLRKLNLERQVISCPDHLYFSVVEVVWVRQQV